MSEKIKPQHLERKAILYIWQSSAYQVSHNLESQKLRYAMEQRLRQLGWREIEIVDEDLGRLRALDLIHAMPHRPAVGGRMPGPPPFNLSLSDRTLTARFRAPAIASNMGANGWRAFAQAWSVQPREGWRRRFETVPCHHIPKHRAKARNKQNHFGEQ